MPRLIWAPSALADVQRLYRFLALKDVDAARRAVKAIRTGVSALADQPRLGRPVEDMAEEYREWVVDFGDSGYIALYRNAGGQTVILAVRHQKEAGY